MTKPPTWKQPQVQLVYAPNQATTAEAPPWFNDILPYVYRAFATYSSRTPNSKGFLSFLYRAFPTYPSHRP